MTRADTPAPKSRLASASMYFLLLWVAVWAFFMMLRFSSFDVRSLPGAGMLFLTLLAYAVLAPLGAAGLSVASIIRKPAVPLGWVTLALAIAAFAVQGAVFMVSKWL